MFNGNTIDFARSMDTVLDKEYVLAYVQYRRADQMFNTEEHFIIYIIF